MKQSLVIVESKAKAETISNVLGQNYVVMLTEGHICELPTEGLAVNSDFEPEFILLGGKEETIRSLKTIARESAKTYIATDPDREGEMLAWHLYNILKDTACDIKRVAISELTKNAIKRAIAHSSKISNEKVAAQKARRVIDHLTEYHINPILGKAISSKVRIERIPSVALRILCDREDKIAAFTPEEYWTCTVELQGKKTRPFSAALLKIHNEKIVLPDKYYAEVVLSDLKQRTFVVQKIERTKLLRKPEPPFITATMLQEACERFGFSTSQAIKIARQLYEGIEIKRQGPVGLITFILTDTTRVTDEALLDLRSLIITDYGKEYLPKKPRCYKQEGISKDGSQAIIPTSLRRSPKSLKNFLSKEQYKLYELIWRRFVASQMQNAEFERIDIEIGSGDDNLYLLNTTGSIMGSRGFLQVYEDFNKEDGDNNNIVPENLRQGEKLRLLNILPKQRYTAPPEQYNDRDLIQELYSRGVGCPNMYAKIIDTLISCGFVSREGDRLAPTDLGYTVNAILVQNFSSVLNVPFTARTEDDLHKVESGEMQFKEAVSHFYRPFMTALDNVNKPGKSSSESFSAEDADKCPRCGKILILRKGKFGHFFACESSDCRFTKSAEKDTLHINEKCALCGRDMVVKVGRFGRFLSCCGFPECKNSKPFHIGVKCPQKGCAGDIIERKSGQGRLFYGCSNYPNCRFVSWQKPVAYRCLKCGNYYVESILSQDKGEYLSCPKCKTDYDLDMVPFGEGTEVVEM